MEYEFLIDVIPERYRFGDEIAAFRGIDIKEVIGKELMITDSYHIIVKKGSLDLRLNGEFFRHMTAGTLIFCTRSTTVEFVNVSDDFEGCHLWVCRKFMSDLLIQKKPFPHSFFSKINDYHLFELTAQNTALLCERTYNIEKDILRVGHVFHREILLSDFTLLLMDMGDIFTRDEKNDESTKDLAAGRKDAVVMQFMDLLDEFGGKKREVSFYADKLCITPQYLARLIKTKTGYTVYEHISRRIMIHAKLIMRTNDISIQEVAERLEFADQASFGKFFKKYAGVSPVSYKNRM